MRDKIKKQAGGPHCSIQQQFWYHFRNLKCETNLNYCKTHKSSEILIHKINK